jgi:glycosyltransferase involved in cell wall biosynthesis
MKKALIVSTVSRQFYLFEQGNIEVLESLGYEVHCAANYIDINERLNNLNIVRQPFDIQRSPFSILNLKAYRQLKNLMKSENFDIVHCHSPMGGVLARLAARATNTHPVIYTAHGFHFYKGAPLINWLLYYPIEKILSKYTNVIITINKEDNERSKKFWAKKTSYVPGIGIDVKKTTNTTIDRDKKREELNLPNEALVILSVGELNKNKNHESMIKALKKIDNPNVYYIICGQGDRIDYLRDLAKSQGVSNRVRLLGYRNDVTEIYKISDIFVFPSYREGLSVALMEAMASSLPVVCSDIRGNKDLIEHGKGGYLFSPNDINKLVRDIRSLIENPVKRHDMGKYNLNRVIKMDKEIIKEKMTQIYSEEHKSV